MKFVSHAAILALLVTACATSPRPGAPQPVPQPAAPAAQPAPSAATRFSVPVEYHKLPNGLKVVLSPDHTAPTVTVALYYGIGFRVEPRDRTGFAHLFEHLMFQGSQNLGKMEFIKLVQSNGGVLNGSTRFDFTNYFEIVPSNTLRTMLWAEADRMRGLNITEENLTNQKGVVSNEVRVNVLNRPYGGFPWIDMPMVANANWYNAHNFYGDLTDIEAAKLSDASAFFKTYYAPNNCAMAIVGDFDPVEAMNLVNQYFGPIPSQPQPPKADISEPRQTAEKRSSKDDAKATRPAIALAWHAPAENTPEYYAMGIIDQILASGKDSWLYQDVVQKRGLTGEIDSTLNALGSMFDINGPTLYMVWMFHDKDKTDDQILKAIDENIARLQTQPVDAATLDRARVKMRSSLYDEIEALYGFGRADLLASFALFDDDPAKINRIEDEFARVTPELIQRTAQEYLRTTNRTILTVVPKGQ
ncbi:MAG TPA: pitrilysin family protein [Thermoanaerobaculia bacterium]|nr:pitrilysin family protein [Thermoanaerobaculia bacterium]